MKTTYRRLSTKRKVARADALAHLQKLLSEHDFVTAALTESQLAIETYQNELNTSQLHFAAPGAHMSSVFNHRRRLATELAKEKTKLVALRQKRSSLESDINHAKEAVANAQRGVKMVR